MAERLGKSPPVVREPKSKQVNHGLHSLLHIKETDGSSPERPVGGVEGGRAVQTQDPEWGSDVWLEREGWMESKNAIFFPAISWSPFLAMALLQMGSMW